MHFSFHWSGLFPARGFRFGGNRAYFLLVNAVEILFCVFISVFLGVQEAHNTHCIGVNYLDMS